MAKGEYRDKVVVKRRMLVVFFMLFLLLFLLISRLSYVMIAKGKEYKEKAILQWTSDVRIAPKRGRILDRNGEDLAISANVFRVDLDLNSLRETTKKNKLSMNDIAPEIAKILGMESSEVLPVLTKTNSKGKPIGAAILKRRIDKATADKINDFSKNQKLRGIVITGDTKRYYPNGNFLANVVGHTNSDGNGLTGVELYYNKYLSGIPGIKISETDRKSEELPYTISDYTKPIEGKDVVLTIDEMIQYFCEKAASQAMIDNKAKAVSIIAMNPKNGEILGMVNKPDYNPNDPWDLTKNFDENQKAWRNRAVSDTFEPGSIFKVFTATGAMEEGLVKEDDKFNCTGSTVVLGKAVKCWKTTGHGSQNFVDILKNSCNVGFMELGRRLGPEKLNKYIELFGFGKKTGIDLNGEALGIIRKAKDMTALDVAVTSFGQGNTLSCIQYMKGFNAIANGGKLITPHVMKEIVNYDDLNNKKVLQKYSNYNERKIMDEGVAKQLRSYLEQVVENGGGKKAFIAGYHIAGKTGTAQKINTTGAGYAPGKYVSSFAGMAPANDPQITLLINIDEPDPSWYYGGQIATVVGKQVFNDVFNYLSFKSDASKEETSKSLLKDVIVPEVRGLKKSEAEKSLKDNNLKVKLSSDGEVITDMTPKPGYTVKEGTEIILHTGELKKDNNMVMVPNIIGSSPEKTTALLGSLGLKAKFVGNGIVAEQSIECKEVKKGTTITIHLDITAD
ncbi:stage V sporulation protein D [Clostridium sp. CM028]|uniref:stage V sporulation protein D n=1 Tax=unclassified Clostridium TaxID=2614128 RepID=UPI001C6E656A|nr:MULTISPECIES: stage V sporulation protein D [unclassified Clostridium]MBW9144225.1 stage V sporulation protein D [Clostridium sp. CM027]MBW9147465.1 stage V sporulation protein D [Clostridium sp. CM028]UVE41137.1 stage V sporulation protein D [Clostridium sp. CM027]WLC61804.1 stage V sporulation protein D [Clostridium sp. CM028]